MHSTTAANSVAASPLFKLPAELRLQIYEFALCSDGDQVAICDVTREDGIPEPALLFTSKTVRTEAIAVFYTVNRFRLITESLHPAVYYLIHNKLDALDTARVGISSIKAIFATKNRMNFRNLILWLQYVHLGKMAISPFQGAQVSLQVRTELDFLDSLFEIAQNMQGKPWEKVESIIEGLRGGLVALNEEWKDDA